MVHNLLPIFGLLESPLVIYYSFRKRFEFLILVLPVFIYSSLYSLAAGSRFLVLNFFVLSLTIYILKEAYPRCNILRSFIFYFLWALMSLRYQLSGFGIFPSF